MRPPLLAAVALAVMSTTCFASTSAPVTAVVLYPGSSASPAPPRSRPVPAKSC
ncbi:hypothetical protein LP420_20745 [Massilia sp. B-10]|nr:hypothetical protein LP420_20745 [Massilia sp. B-10]